MTDYTTYRFFKENGGWRVGHKAEDALSLARAEKRFADLDGEIEWVYDDEPFDPGDVCTAEEAAKKFESNEWTGPFGCIVKLDGEDDSLWGIVVGQRGTNDPYCRVVAAELADQLLDRRDRELAERERAANQDIATREVAA